MRYKKDAADLHIIFAYLQIGKIYSTKVNLPKYALYHPHSNKYSSDPKWVNNCIYEASDFLGFDNSKPGYGCLSFKKNLVLTKDGEIRSHWKLPAYFKNVKISYHTENSFNDSYFESAKRGQEFVIDADNKIIYWAKELISLQ